MVFAAVDTDHVARDPVRVRMREDRDRPRDVVGGRQASAGVGASGGRFQPVVLRDLLRRRRRRHARADRVDRDALRRELRRELPHVRLERGLRGGDRPVRRQDARAAGRRHRVDAAAGLHHAAADHLLRPVDEAVRHHVDRHVHLGGRHRVLQRVRDEPSERAERERVDEHAQLSGFAALGERRLHRGHRLGAALRVGGVDVEEACLAAGRANVRRHALGVRERGLAVEVDAEDVQAGPREAHADGIAEAGGRAEDEGPALEMNRIGGQRHGPIVPRRA